MIPEKYEDQTKVLFPIEVRKNTVSRLFNANRLCVYSEDEKKKLFSMKAEDAIPFIIRRTSGILTEVEESGGQKYLSFTSRFPWEYSPSEKKLKDVIDLRNALSGFLSIMGANTSSWKYIDDRKKLFIKPIDFDITDEESSVDFLQRFIEYRYFGEEDYREIFGFSRINGINDALIKTEKYPFLLTRLKNQNGEYPKNEAYFFLPANFPWHTRKYIDSVSGDFELIIKRAPKIEFYDFPF